MDMDSSFDNVHYKQMDQRLNHLKISSYVKSWIMNFLQNRTLQFKFGEKVSDSFDIPTGVF